MFCLNNDTFYSWILLIWNPFYPQWTVIGGGGDPGGRAVCPVGRGSMRDRDCVITHPHSLVDVIAVETMSS